MNNQTTAVEYSETIIYCPCCGVDNHIPNFRTVGDTTGVLYCIKCGRRLDG